MFTRLALLFVAAASTGAASAQQVPSPQPAIQTPADALTQDGAAYAALVGVPPAIGERRLRLQEASVAVTDALRETWRERLAGIAIEQSPTMRIAVLLTGEAPVASELVRVDDAVLPVVYRTGAPATLVRLRAALAERQAAIRLALAHSPGTGIDQRTGELVVVVARADLEAEGADVLTARLAAVAGVPVRVRSIDVAGLDQSDLDQAGPDAAVTGGGRLVGSVPGDPRRYVCTAGFVVTDGVRTGIATAAHCPDVLAYADDAGREHGLAFVGQWGWGFQDVQINASDVPLAPLFRAGSAADPPRPVLGQRAAAGMRAGDIVCHRGERTGYSCAAVELTDFAPAGDLCGGACSPTWITVAGPRCGGGDSGSPVFVGTTALGLLKGGSYRADGGCSFYFYMPIEYLPTGWRLLTGADPPPAAAPPAQGPRPAS